MPWSTPTLKQVRSWTRDYVLSQLGAVSMVPNSALRIMSDAKAGLAHLALLYLDWLAKQLMPDTAETEWLDRHGNIWLTNADGSKGRKAATYASGSIKFEGSNGIIVPVGTIMRGASGYRYQTTEEAEIDITGFSTVTADALDAGVGGNLQAGDGLSFETVIPGISATARVVVMDGGVDTENDDSLRERVLFRIQNPPMGGSQADYIRWARAVAGVTRAWAEPEMGPGTMTVRFMMDDLRGGDFVITTDTVSGHGLPNDDDIEEVRAYLDSVRPVTVKDMWALAPVPYFYDITISNLSNDTPTTRAKIRDALEEMEFQRSKPGQTMFRSWVDEAISSALGEDHHELTFDTVAMPAAGYMPFLRDITYV